MQHQPAHRKSVSLCLAMLLLTLGWAPVAWAQARSTEVKWDNYVFKFLPGGQMAQVFQDGKVVGTILYVNGEQKVLPIVPEPEATKLKKSFDDYKAFNARSHSGDAPAVAANPGPSAGEAAGSPAGQSAGQPEAISFDDANHTITVPRPEGVTVTFVGQDVKITGFQRGNYVLRHQKGGAGRMLEGSILHPNRAGGSISGGGIEFLREGGGIIYDSGMGGVNLQENRQVLTAKQLSKVAVDAVADVRQVPGHENFAPPGYNTLKEISQYRLRSDGSR